MNTQTLNEALAILALSTDPAARVAYGMLAQMPTPVVALKPRKANGVKRAMTAADILQPVGRRKLPRNPVKLTVESTFTDGEVIRLTVGRHPSDSDAVALECGRRLAIIFKAREMPANGQDYTWRRLGDRWALGLATDRIERARDRLATCVIAHDSLYASAA